MTLFVVGEGRYQPRNMPIAPLDPSSIRFDPATGTTNYTTEREKLLALEGHSTWLAAYSRSGTLFDTFENPENSAILRYSLPNGWSYATFVEAYVEQGFATGETSSSSCANALLLADDDRRVVQPCDPSGECRYVDPASEIDVRTLSCAPPIGSDVPFDDLAAALVGMHPSDVWVTRLEANLARSAMNRDLELGAHPTQTEISQFVTPLVGGGSECASAGATVARNGSGARGIGVFGGVASTLLLAALRRRRREARRSAEGVKS